MSVSSAVATENKEHREVSMAKKKKLQGLFQEGVVWHSCFFMGFSIFKKK